MSSFDDVMLGCSPPIISLDIKPVMKTLVEVLIGNCDVEGTSLLL